MSNNHQPLVWWGFIAFIYSCQGVGEPATEGSTFDFHQTYVAHTPFCEGGALYYLLHGIAFLPPRSADNHRCAFTSFVVTFGTRLGHGSSGAQMYSVACWQLLFSLLLAMIGFYCCRCRHTNTFLLHQRQRHGDWSLETGDWGLGTGLREKRVRKRKGDPLDSSTCKLLCIRTGYPRGFNFFSLIFVEF